MRRFGRREDYIVGVPTIGDGQTAGEAMGELIGELTGEAGIVAMIGVEPIAGVAAGVPQADAPPGCVAG